MVKVLDVKLFDKDIPTAIEIMLEQCRSGQKQNFMISARDAHGLVLAYRDLEFHYILNSFFMNLPDGMPLVWVGRLKGARTMQRCYGPEFFQEVILASKDLPIRHFLCGGVKGVAAELKKVCEERWCNRNVVGIYTPPFCEMSDDELRLSLIHI